ncbi:hypothetical protein GF354_05305 [Candidatus Peregrinibacteria bacterium]|nr:hypothetical protein [Candidatus Peregrinibacteria bacterium]
MKKIIIVLFVSALLSACTNQVRENEMGEINEEPETVETGEAVGISAEMSEKHDLTDAEVTQLEEMGLNDENIEVWLDEIKAMGPGPFDIYGELSDVSGGNAEGQAGAQYTKAGYSLYARFSGLPHPEEGYFYEGWVVRQDPLSVLSTGKAERNLGDYINSYFSNDDLLDHDFYVLTLEPDDGDPAPAEHILEGTMQ